MVGKQPLTRGYLVKRVLRTGETLTPEQLSDRTRIPYGEVATILKIMEEEGTARRMEDGAYRFVSRAGRPPDENEEDH